LVSGSFKRFTAGRAQRRKTNDNDNDNDKGETNRKMRKRPFVPERKKLHVFNCNWKMMILTDDVWGLDREALRVRTNVI